MYSRAVAEVEKGISMKEQSRPLFVPHALSARRDCLRRRQWRRRGAGHMMRGEVALRPMKHGVPGLSSGVPHGRRLAAWASSCSGVHWEYFHCTTTVRWYGALRTIEVLCVHTVPTVPHHDWSAGNLYTDSRSCAEYLSTVAYRHALLLACNSWLPRLFEPRTGREREQGTERTYHS